MGQSLTTQGYGTQGSYIVVNGLVGPDGNRKKFKSIYRYSENDKKVLKNGITAWALNTMFQTISEHSKKPGNHIHIHIDTNHSMIDIENLYTMVKHVFDDYNSGKVDMMPPPIAIHPFKIIFDYNFIGFDDDKSRNNKIIVDSLVKAISSYAEHHGYPVSAKSSKAAETEVGHVSWFDENE